MQMPAIMGIQCQISADPNFITTKMKHNRVLTELQVNTNSTEGRNVSTEMNMLNSTNQKGKPK